jgi:hypothetical protein
MITMIMMRMMRMMRIIAMMKHKQIILLLMILPHISLHYVVAQNGGNAPLSYEEAPSQEEAATDEAKKSFVEKHARKLIALSIAGGLSLIPLLLWYTNSNQSTSTSQETTTGKATPSHVSNKASPSEKTIKPQGQTEDTGKSGTKETTMQNNPQRATALEKLYYEPEVQTQRKSFEKLWKACKDDSERTNLKKAFYEKMVGPVSQDEVFLQYAHHNSDAGNNTPPISFQAAQENFQKKHTADALTPFDNYEIALTLQTQGTTSLETIYDSVKSHITQFEGGNHTYPEYNDLKKHPEFLAMTGEIRALINHLAKKTHYKNVKVFERYQHDVSELHQLGLLIRKNPDTLLDRTQREKLYRTDLPLDQAQKIIVHAAENQNSRACKQALEWLALNKEVATLALDMETCFLNKDQSDDTLDVLAESCREKEKNVFKQDIFGKAFAKIKEALEAHKEEAHYTLWQTKMETIPQRSQNIITAQQAKLDQLLAIIKPLIPQPTANTPQQLSADEYKERLEKPFSKLTEQERAFIMEKTYEHWKSVWFGRDPLYFLGNIPDYGKSTLDLFNTLCRGWTGQFADKPTE